MQNNRNQTQITEIIKNFYNITHLKTTIFSVEGKTLAEFPKEHCAFCHLINSSESGTKNCEKSNLKALNTCKKTHQTFVYRCHMGLVEVAFPLIKNEQIIGYAMFGQINNQKTNQSIKEKLLKFNNQIDEKMVNELLKSIDYHSNEMIKSEIKILEICATYIISEQMIEYNANLINQILDFIENTPLNQFSIKLLCDSLNVSRSLIYETFTKHKKMGICEYVRKRKIEKACELLKSQKYSIKEIAYITGFNDSNHFIKTFKKKYNITPKKFQTEK